MVVDIQSAGLTCSPHTLTHSNHTEY